MGLASKITNALLAGTNLADAIQTNVPRPQTRALPPRFTITAEVKIALMGWMRFR